MSKYLKMADVFAGEVRIARDTLYDAKNGCIADFIDLSNHCRYAAHAINHHDALVKENEKLRELLTKCQPYVKDESDWGNDLEVKLLEEINQALGEAK